MTGDVEAFPPALSVIAGHTYTGHAQVFNRWFLPTYRTSFRWTGNRSDAEDATSWVFANAVRCIALPERVSVVDDGVYDATLEAASRHWSDRYGVHPLRCAEIYASDAAISDQAVLTLETLVEDLSAEMRLVIVLRFLRKRQMSAIAVQLGVPQSTANDHLYTALSRVAERIGLDAMAGHQAQAGLVAGFVDAVVGKRRPLRFEVAPPAWPALVAATHLHAAVAGNDLPRPQFVRVLRESFQAGDTRRPRRHVTHLRIWSA